MNHAAQLRNWTAAWHVPHGPKLVAFQDAGARVCQVTCQPQVDQVGRANTQI